MADASGARGASMGTAPPRLTATRIEFSLLGQRGGVLVVDSTGAPLPPTRGQWRRTRWTALSGATVLLSPAGDRRVAGEVLYGAAGSLVHVADQRLLNAMSRHTPAWLTRFRLRDNQ